MALESIAPVSCFYGLANNTRVCWPHNGQDSVPSVMRPGLKSNAFFIILFLFIILVALIAGRLDRTFGRCGCCLAARVY